MAGRRARNAPSPPPEPEPDPEKADTSARLSSKNVSFHLNSEGGRKKSIFKDDLERSKCPEKIVERIVIGQDTLNQACGNARGARSCRCKKRNKKSTQKPENSDPCNRDKDMSLITWIQDKSSEKPESSSPPIIVCQKPAMCCCKKHKKSHSKNSDKEKKDEFLDYKTYISFTNILFTTARAIPD